MSQWVHKKMAGKSIGIFLPNFKAHSAQVTLKKPFWVDCYRPKVYMHQKRLSMWLLLTNEIKCALDEPTNQPIVHDMKLTTCGHRTELFSQTERFCIIGISNDPKLLKNLSYIAIVHVTVVDQQS